MSVKARITLWYAASLFVILVLSLAFLIGVGGAQAKNNLRDTLIAAVEREAARVEFDEYDKDDDDLSDPHVFAVTDSLLVELDDINFYQNGAYLSVYLNNRAIDGVVPEGLVLQPPSVEGLREQDGYYIYDLAVTEKNATVWVRGCADISAAAGTFSALANLAFIALPGVLVVAVAGGYLITRRSFRLVNRIAQTAQDIADSGDFSKRIGAKPNGDELHKLANTFDRMFDRVQESFEKEKQFTSDASHELRTQLR